MTYECFVKPLASGEMAITAAAQTETPPVRPGTVLLEVERSVVDSQHLNQVLTSAQTGQEALSLGWCSLVGRVVQVGHKVDQIRIGERVSTIGPVASQVVLAADQCLVLPDEIEADQAAHWALLLTLFRSISELQIEIGGAVLVCGGGLVGELVAQLSLVAGAAFVVGLDPERSMDHPDSESELGPRWVADFDSLQHLLAGQEVDLLIDVLGEFVQLNKILSAVRFGGRVLLLATKHAAPLDFDFYPGFHRRSLKVTSQTLIAALTQNSSGKVSSPGEAEFIDYLLANHRLSLPHWTVVTGRLLQSGEAQILSTSVATSLMVQWHNNEQTN